LVVAATTTVHAATFFVDISGDDSNGGTSAARPLRTIQRALDEAAQTPGPDTIKIAAGEYVENVTIEDTDKVTLAGRGGAVIRADDRKENVITIECSDVTIANLEITGGDDGIKTKTGPISLTLRDVVVSGNAEDGLDARNVSSLMIVHGTFSQNGDDGIKVKGAETAAITGTAVLDNGEEGVDFENIGAIHIRHLTAEGNRDDGIKVEWADVVRITATSVLHNGGDGVDLETIGAIHVTNLTADWNGDEGLEVDDSGRALVVGGSYSNNADDGIDLDDTQSIRIVSVVSTGNDGSGLQVEAEGHFDTDVVSIVNSEFSDNGEDGIQIREEDAIVHQVRLTSVTARNNVESGLDINVSGSVRLTRVISQDNGEDDILP
jgi:hypothetical protein